MCTICYFNYINNINVHSSIYNIQIYDYNIYQIKLDISYNLEYFLNNDIKINQNILFIYYVNKNIDNKKFIILSMKFYICIIYIHIKIFYRTYLKQYI